MYTTVFIKNFLDFIKIPIDIKHICVFCAPAFSILTVYAGYLMTIEINGWVESGLLCALFISVVPAYLSWSVAGSYDNEAISITLLLLTFYFFLKGCRTGKLIDSCLSALLYSYLVSSWGGYSFPIAFIPLYILFCLLTNHYSFNMYKNYT